jgi:hypothetical protein
MFPIGSIGRQLLNQSNQAEVRKFDASKDHHGPRR